jgi:hypothetical protein
MMTPARIAAAIIDHTLELLLLLVLVVVNWWEKRRKSRKP